LVTKSRSLHGCLDVKGTVAAQKFICYNTTAMQIEIDTGNSKDYKYRVMDSRKGKICRRLATFDNKPKKK